MTREYKNHAIKSSIIGCGLPTAIINGLLAYFTGKQMTFAQSGVDLIATVAGVAFFVTVIVYPLMKKLSHTMPEIGISKEELPFFSKLPTGVLPLSLTVTLIATIVFALIPFGILSLLPMPEYFNPTHFAIFKGLYSIPVAAIVNFIAATMSKLVVTVPQKF